MFNFSIDWQDYLVKLVTYAGENPWSFLYYTLLILSPLFAASAYLSYRLIQEIDKKEKETKRRNIKTTNKNKVNKKRD